METKSQNGKQVETRVIEFSGVMVDAKQNHKKTKRVNEPHTLITIAVPLMDNRKFEEMCFNNGYKLCYKIEYVPRKEWMVENQ